MKKTWSQEEISQIYHQPFMELVYQAATTHRQHHDPQEVQVCTLLSIKTGGCPEDCSYCPQAARYHTHVKAHKLLDVNEVMQKATQHSRPAAPDSVWELPGAKSETTAILIRY